MALAYCAVALIKLAFKKYAPGTTLRKTKICNIFCDLFFCCILEFYNQKTMTNFAEIPLQYPQCWRLDISNRILFDGVNQIHLTSIESVIVKSMLLKEDRVISKAELISSIGRDPDLYRGLQMSLSRLQIKFKKNAGGSHLFRTVRNRGYCLTQTIHINGGAISGGA